jgi:hypothetical protein
LEFVAGVFTFAFLLEQNLLDGTQFQLTPIEQNLTDSPSWCSIGALEGLDAQGFFDLLSRRNFQSLRDAAE